MSKITTILELMLVMMVPVTAVSFLEWLSHRKEKKYVSGGIVYKTETLGQFCRDLLKVLIGVFVIFSAILYWLPSSE
jgi:hypothetical protein